MKRLSLISLLILSFFSLSRANNVQIPDKPSLLGKNKTDHTVYVNFKLTWENSWRASTPANWDAVWVFAKYREADEWKSIYIDTNALAHQIKANVNMSIKVGKSTVHSIVNGEDTEDIQALGAFIYRKEVGRGNITIDSVKLKWHYGKQDIDDGAILSIRVFAIEMVYVPQGAYYLGDETSNNRALSNFGNSGDLYIGGSPFRERNPAQPTTSIFKTLGTVTYPTGAINTIGNGSNGAPSGWYKERNSNGAEVWRSSATTWSSVFGSLVLNPTVHNSSNAFWDNSGGTITTGNGPIGTGGTVLGTVKNIVIKMPAPFKASHAYFGGWNASTALPHQTNRFMIRARKDTINWASYEDGKWVDLGGDLTTNLLASGSYVVSKKNYVLDPVLIDTFSYYEFRYTFQVKANGPIFDGLGISDESPGGFPENEYYYTRQYSGAMPLKWLASNLISSPTYPNGYEAFYMMKYELSQHGYVDFLNTLNLSQQKNRAGVDPSTGTEGFYHATNTAIPPTAFRNYVILKKKGTDSPAYYYCYQGNARDINDYNLQGGTIAMTWLSWADITAYLCWSGLRPLTELEYEKACKGPNKPISGQFAWGTNSAIVHTSINPLGLYTDEENVLPTNANFAMQGTGIYPVRVGCFATQASTRSDAGAGYYGNMNLSDNASEFYINCETIEGLQFNGAHGSGELDGNGEAQVATWPDNIGNGGGLILKGLTGSSSATPYAEVAHRTWSPWTAYTSRNQWMGCRGGRTAPK